MKRAQKSEYGLLALLELARDYGQGPLQSAVIAGRRAIPAQYLQQILIDLRHAGLISSGGGPRGGHELARPPEEITLLEAIEALEGSTAPMECIRPGVQPGCPQRGHCVLADVWRRVDEATQGILRQVTLAGLARQEEARDAAPMYYI